MPELRGPISSTRRRLGWTDLDVAPIALGTMQFGWTMSDVASMDLLDAYVEAGGNFIDTADMYGPDQHRRSWGAARAHVGVSEDIIGRWMRDRGNRDHLVIATKVRARMWDGPDGEGLSRAHMIKALDDSLRRLGVDVIDLYQAHWPDDGVALEEMLATFGEMIDAGKIRYVGTSNYAALGYLAKIVEICRSPGYPHIASEQPRFSLVNQDEYHNGLAELARVEQIGLICYSPLAAGFLTGKYRRDDQPRSGARLPYVSQYFNENGWRLIEALQTVASAHAASVSAVALAWILAQPGITAVIAGANSTAQLNDWLPATAVSLDASEVGRLGELGWKHSKIEFSSW